MADCRGRFMPGRLALGPKLQPVAKIAANQLLQPLDLALEPPPDVLLHAEWQGLAPCRDTIPFQQARCAMKYNA